MMVQHLAPAWCRGLISLWFGVLRPCAAMMSLLSSCCCCCGYCALMMLMLMGCYFMPVAPFCWPSLMSVDQLMPHSPGRLSSAWHLFTQQPAFVLL